MATPNPIGTIERGLLAATLARRVGAGPRASPAFQLTAVTGFEVGQASHAVSPAGCATLPPASPGIEQKREKPILALPLAPGQEAGRSGAAVHAPGRA